MTLRAHLVVIVDTADIGVEAATGEVSQETAAKLLAKKHASPVICIKLFRFAAILFSALLELFNHIRAIYSAISIQHLL